MTETLNPPPAPTPPPPTSAVSDERQMALVIYILYLVPTGITHVIGLVLAYVSRDTAPEWLKTHYTFQIRTFWIGLLYFVVACFSMLIVIGVVLVPLVILWVIIRCALGLSRLTRNEAYPTPESWTI